MQQLRVVHCRDMKRHYFYFIAKTQMYLVDMPTYLGAKEKALNEGFSENDAIDLAGQAVLDSQTGGNIKDLSRVQRGTPGFKIWSNFYSYFNGTLNLTAEAYQKADFTKPASVGKFIWDIVWLYSIPAVLQQAVFAGLRGDDDDDEDMVDKIMIPQLSYLFGTMIFVREFGGAIEGFYSYNGPPGIRIMKEVGSLGVQASQGEADKAFWRAFSGVAGITLHLPTTQVYRTIDATMAYSEGKAPITSLAVGKPRRQ